MYTQIYNLMRCFECKYKRISGETADKFGRHRPYIVTELYNL